MTPLQPNNPTPSEPEESEPAQSQLQRDNPFASLDSSPSPAEDTLTTHVHPLLGEFEDKTAAQIADAQPLNLEEPRDVHRATGIQPAVSARETADAPDTQLHPLLDAFQDQVAAAIAEGTDLHDSSEVADGVTDSSQESPTLDARTQSRLEHQEQLAEEEEFASPVAEQTPVSPLPRRSAETAEVKVERESDDALVERSPHPDALVAEVRDEIIDSQQEQAVEPEMPVAAIEPIAPSVTIDEGVVGQVYRYRIAAVLPDTLRQAIEDALAAVGLQAVAFPGVFQWQASFQTDTPQAVASALDAWVQKHLPLQTAIERVYCDVVGAQTYVAGWRLANAKAIYQAHTALTTALATLVVPDIEVSAIFRAIVPVLPQVPVEHFPLLVGYLQRNFEPQSWRIEALEILRQPLEDETATWERMGIFRAET